MANNLKLVTTENFGDLPCDFYRNRNDEILLTREQIGTALEYSNPANALNKIHQRHKDRLDQYSVVDKLGSTDGKSYDTILYTQRGVMEICRWSNKPKANLFMDWVWDIVEKYRNGELNSQLDISQLSEIISKGISDALKPLYETIEEMQEEIHEIKESQKKVRHSKRNQPSAWYKKMVPKYKMLMKYFDCTRSELYSSIFMELEDMYGVDIDQVYEDYCYENGLGTDECYRMDAIEHDIDLRDALTLLVDDSLVKYGLKTREEIENDKRKTLFVRK